MTSLAPAINASFGISAAGVTTRLEDYAFFIWGLLELYENTYDPRHLKSAVDLNNQMQANLEIGKGD